MKKNIAVMGMAASAMAQLNCQTPKQQPIVIVVEDELTDERVLKAIEEIKRAYPGREVIARPLSDMPEEYKPTKFDFQAAIIQEKKKVEVSYKVEAKPVYPSKYQDKLKKRYAIQEREALKKLNKGV